MRRLAPLLGTLLLASSLLAGCGSDGDRPTSAPSPPALWNPCDALDAREVSRLLGVRFTMATGTETEPACRFTPTAAGGPAVDANYQLLDAGLDEVFDTMTHLDPSDVTRLRVRGADAARLVVDFDDRQLFVTGFVQDGDLIQTVDVVDPRPYDRARVVRGVRAMLADVSAAAP